MGKDPALTQDELFERAERVRMDAAALRQQLADLRDLRRLERELRALTRRLAGALWQPGAAPPDLQPERAVIRAADEAVDSD